jgi:hypothetical protein
MEKIENTNIGGVDRIPSPGVPALLYLILFAGGMAFNLMNTSGASFPTPYDPAQKAQDYYQQYHNITQVYSFFIFWSSIPLGIFTAFITSRLSKLKIHGGGLNITKFGGYAASGFIALSGLSIWILSQPVVTDLPATTRIVQLFTFVTGGTGNVTFSGLLIAGLSVSAGLAKLLPGWIMWSGILLAAVSVLSMLNMILPQLSMLLPIGRFLGMIWMVIAGFKLKKSLP